MVFTWSPTQNAFLNSNESVRAIVTLVAWLIVSLAVLAMLGLFTSERYFIISYVGLLSIMHIYAPVDPQSRWWTVLRWMSIVGFLVFMTIIYWQVSVVLES